MPLVRSRLAFRQECRRILRRGGLLLSISFASPARLDFLSRVAPSLGFTARPHIVSPPDRRPVETAAPHSYRLNTILIAAFCPSLENARSRTALVAAKHSSHPGRSPGPGSL